MATYEVGFIQSHCYEIEADSEEEAFDKAMEEFLDDMHRPIANTDYDDYFIDELDENGTPKTIKEVEAFG
jgi:hypothetical protein